MDICISYDDACCHLHVRRRFSPFYTHRFTLFDGQIAAVTSLACHSLFGATCHGITRSCSFFLLQKESKWKIQKGARHQFPNDYSISIPLICCVMLHKVTLPEDFYVKQQVLRDVNICPIFTKSLGEIGLFKMSNCLKCIYDMM